MEKEEQFLSCSKCEKTTCLNMERAEISRSTLAALLLIENDIRGFTVFVESSTARSESLRQDWIKKPAFWVS